MSFARRLPRGMMGAEDRRGRDRGSVALADVLTCCTAADPKDRYRRRWALAYDLRRHVTALPLRGVPNRSWDERGRKWRKRRPLGLPLWLALAAGAGRSASDWSVQGDRKARAGRGGPARWASPC